MMGAWEGAGKERCKLGIEEKGAVRDYLGPDLIHLLRESQKKKEGRE